MDESTQNVRKALENPNYKWQTIGGLASETNLDREKVKEILDSIKDEVLMVEDPVNNRKLYTTKKHYYRKSNFYDHLLTVMSGSVKP